MDLSSPESHLAPCAARSSESRGRRFDEPEHPYRSPYQRDRDRIIHSNAFRRLEYKTQVFVNHEGDHYRTRLTHSIEVAQIARTMARVLRLNEDLTEAVALAHDLGHTPFGHAGERALKRKMEGFGGFEHNVQGLRIVDLLEKRSPAFRGLNLSFEVRASILKHGSSRLPEFEGCGHALLEAQLVDLADSVAYCCHDIDDGLQSGLLSHEQLDRSELWRAAWKVVGKIWPDALTGLLVRQAVRWLINCLVTDIVDSTQRSLRGISSARAAQVAGRPLVCHSEEISSKKSELQDILFHHLYRHYRVMGEAYKSERLLERLFDHFVRHPDTLPDEYQAWVEEHGLHRSVCDYLAGMTDRYVHREYRRLLA